MAFTLPPIKWSKSHKYVTNTNSVTNLELLAPSSGKRLVIHSIKLSVTAAGLYTISKGDNGTTSNLMVYRIPADGSAVESYIGDDKLVLSADQAVKLTHAVTGTTYCVIEYTEVD